MRARQYIYCFNTFHLPFHFSQSQPSDRLPRLERNLEFVFLMFRFPTFPSLVLWTWHGMACLACDVIECAYVERRTYTEPVAVRRACVWCTLPFYLYNLKVISNQNIFSCFSYLWTMLWIGIVWGKFHGNIFISLWEIVTRFNSNFASIHLNFFLIRWLLTAPIVIAVTSYLDVPCFLWFSRYWEKLWK